MTENYLYKKIDKPLFGKFLTHINELTRHSVFTFGEVHESS